MRLALSATTPGLAADQQVALCGQAESLGIEAAWLAEVAGPEAFSLAGAVAAATSRIEIGVAVVAAGNPTPALLAMGAGTVSQVAAGRPFNLGIGSSSEVIMERWHGRSFSEPLQRVKQTVEATRAALAGERDYTGGLAPMASFRLASPPAGPVHLFVAALGPKMLQLAGAVGDGVCLNLMSPDAVPRQLAEIDAGAAGAGRQLPDHFDVMARINWVPGDPVAGRQVIRGAFGPYFAQPVYNRFLAWCGYPEAAAAIADAFAAGDRGAVAAALSDDIVDSIVLLGSAEDAKARLAEFGAAGITTAAVSLLVPDAETAAGALAALIG